MIYFLLKDDRIWKKTRTEEIEVKILQLLLERYKISVRNIYLGFQWGRD